MLHQLHRQLYRQFTAMRAAIGLAIATVLLTVACGSPNATATKTLSVGALPWIGFAGEFIGVEKGLFKAQNLNIQDVGFQNASDEMTAFLTQKLDLAWFTTGDAIQIAAKDPSIKVIFTADYSNGGDGILGRGIKSPADLKGKTVAREDVLYVKILLRHYLAKGNLTEQDITIKDMTADNAATAFASKQVDAAVTFEPQLSKAAKEGSGEIVFSTKDTNLIADVLLVRGDVLQTRKAEVQSYLKAVDQGLKLLLADDPEALKIVGTKLGVSEADVKAQKQVVKIFDAAGNKDIAFNASNPQNLQGNLALMAKGAVDFKAADKAIDTSTLIDDSFVKAL